MQMGHIDTRNIMYVPKDVQPYISQYIISKDDIYISVAGTLGLVGKIPETLDGANLTENANRLTEIECDRDYLMYYMMSPIIQNVIANERTVGAQPKLALQRIRDFDIALPTKEFEQTAIATALSDMDSLISALDKKIEKKKAIKQGLMLQLLTGKKRLPGFTDKWINKELQDILKYTQPTDYIVKSADYIESGTPVLTAGKSFILGYTSEKNGIFNNIPTILFDDFLTCSRYVDFDFKVKSSAVKMLSLKDNKCNLYFVYCKMQQIGYEAADHQRHWISIYSKIKIEIPPTLAEQTAIASILSDCDKEISSLEAKRDKYKEMKQGMMQQLLTGNIRLVQNI